MRNHPTVADFYCTWTSESTPPPPIPPSPSLLFFSGPSGMLLRIAMGGPFFNSSVSPVQMRYTRWGFTGLKILRIPAVETGSGFTAQPAPGAWPEQQVVPSLQSTSFYPRFWGMGNAHSSPHSCIRKRLYPGADVGHFLAVSGSAGDGYTCGRHYSCFQL